MSFAADAIVIPGHRAAMNPESISGMDSRFALTRGPE
jgi:hypothetical protein